MQLVRSRVIALWFCKETRLHYNIAGEREFGTVYYKSIALKDNQVQTVNQDVHLPGVNLQPGTTYTFTHEITIPSSGFTGVSQKITVVEDALDNNSFFNRAHFTTRSTSILCLLQNL